jgi:transposase
MTKKPTTSKDAADKVVKNIRRKTRQTYSAEEKIRIVLAGLRGEESISVLCRREGIAESLYYSWSKEFLEAGKRRLSGGHCASGDVARSEGAAFRVAGIERVRGGSDS